MKTWESLPLFSPSRPFRNDWLINAKPFDGDVYRGKREGTVYLSNGLITRRLDCLLDGTTLDFVNEHTGESVIRSLRPEGQITINGTQYNIGGVLGQEEHAYFRYEWIDQLEKDKNAFHLINFSISPIQKRFEWKRVRHCEDLPWPPKGKMLSLEYRHEKLPGVKIQVNYEIYSGLPLLSKWLVIFNEGELPIKINSFISEILAIVEEESVPQGSPDHWAKPNIHFESDYCFKAMSPELANATIFWEKDPLYTSQVAFNNDNRVLLHSKPPIGPEISVNPNERFETFRTFELIFDSTDKQRKGLSLQQMYKTLAPWVTENPIMMHIVEWDPEKVKPIIDQCAEVGFEMVILSFGSGLNLEWEYPEFYEELEELVNYANGRKVEIGGYSLFASRSIGPEVDVIDPQTLEPNHHATFGSSPCLCSQWGIDYLRKIKHAFEKTGMDILENDGPYPGDLCASENHVGHDGLKDSQWKQWRSMIDLYIWCRERGIYINAPDWYFLTGTNKTGMGYKEVNWSLPRENQIIIARQNIYDGTWNKLPTMGWMFTPLTVYHPVGDWEKSTLEPLSEYLDYYKQHLYQNFLAGVQSCYRGKRLYDTEETKQVVREATAFFKKYRRILESPLIHIRRPDGKRIDGYIHVNPTANPCGLAAFFNPSSMHQKEKFRLSLYYSGVTQSIWVAEQGKNEQKYALGPDSSFFLTVELGAQSFTWFLFKRANFKD